MISDEKIAELCELRKKLNELADRMALQDEGYPVFTVYKIKYCGN